MTQLREAPWKDTMVTLPRKGVVEAQPRGKARANLLRISWLRTALENPWPQFLLRAAALAGFVFTILVGLLGSPVGSHNFAIIFVWIAWWTGLKLVFIPLGGRSWCSVCPIPLAGDWLQQGGIFPRGERRHGMNLRWPKRLQGSWLQSGGFLLAGLFSAVTLTDARVTGWVLLGLLVLAAGLSLVFEKRAFCSHLCPVGGFTGIYAKAAPLELSVIEPSVCTAHSEKTCYMACPWGLYPLALGHSAAARAQCGLCMECLRACPSSNIALNLRSFGADLDAVNSIKRAAVRLDEAFFALVMLGSALSYSVVFTGPWGGLKSAAFAIGTPAWLWFALGLLTLNLLALPGAFALAVWAGRRFSAVNVPLRRDIANYAQALLPLGLLAWIAFTLSFALPKLDTVFTVLADPLGWGWNLLGAAGTVALPDSSAFSSAVQAALLLVGLFWSARVISRNSGKAGNRRGWFVLLFCLVYALGLLWLLVG